jgi:hypothetical protein
MPMRDYIKEIKLNFFNRLVNNNYTLKIINELLTLKTSASKIWKRSDSFLIEIIETVQSFNQKLTNINIDELVNVSHATCKTLKQDFYDDYLLNAYVNQIKTVLATNSGTMVNDLNELLMPYQRNIAQ